MFSVPVSGRFMTLLLVVVYTAWMRTGI